MARDLDVEWADAKVALVKDSCGRSRNVRYRPEADVEHSQLGRLLLTFKADVWLAEFTDRERAGITSEAVGDCLHDGLQMRELVRVGVATEALTSVFVAHDLGYVVLGHPGMLKGGNR